MLRITQRLFRESSWKEDDEGAASSVRHMMSLSAAVFALQCDRMV
jgi:hypothetical protein